jgi:hypothetical protein
MDSPITNSDLENAEVYYNAEKTGRDEKRGCAERGDRINRAIRRRGGERER